MRLFLLFMFVFLLSTCDGVDRVVVEEGSDALLSCSVGTKQNIERDMFDWRKDNKKEVFRYNAGCHDNNGLHGQDKRFSGRVTHFPHELNVGNASIIIRKAVMSDAGNYTCVFPRLRPGEVTHVMLIVGAISKPRIQMLDATKDGVLLTCEVRDAFPKPELEWLDSDGNVLHAEEPQITESGGRFTVSLRTTVTKTGTNRFRCVAKQQTINHVTDDDVIVPEKMFENCNTGQWICEGLGLGLGLSLRLGLGLGAVCGIFFTALFIRSRKNAQKGTAQRDRDWHYT